MTVAFGGISLLESVVKRTLIDGSSKGVTMCRTWEPTTFANYLGNNE